MTINHGTRGGYYAHRRVNSTPCDACRAAINEYVKEYRAKNGLARNRRSESFRRKALIILRDNHRAEYDELVAKVESETIAAEDAEIAALEAED